MRIEQKLSFPIFFIIIGNILTGIIKSSPVIDLVLYIVPFIILIFLLFFKVIKLKNTTMSIILLLFSCLSMFQEDITALNDITFLILSLFICVKSKKVYLIYGAIYSILLLTRYTLTEMSLSEIVTHISGISFIFILYQHYMHVKKKEKSYIKVIEKLDIAFNPHSDVVNIVYHKGNGCDFYKISDILREGGKEITPARCRRKVREEMNRLKIDNLEEFIFKLVKNGYYPDILPKTNIDNKECDNL